MVYMVDIDGIICTNTNGDYEYARPLPDNIAKVNALYDAGHDIILWTSRGATTGIDWEQLTREQLSHWQVKYHEVRFGKPHYDAWIDDKAVQL